MNNNENNFEALRQLLALKRHEVPPPGYFNSFSGEVITRIRAGEAGERSGAARAPGKIHWLVRFLQIFEAKPAFAGAFASAMGLVLLFGIFFAERPDNIPQPLLTSTDQSGVPMASMAPTAFAQASNPTILAFDSTNPVMNLQPVATLFGQQNPLVTPVSFSPSGN